MHHKNIKILVRKQLKKQYPNWSHTGKKTKKKPSVRCWQRLPLNMISKAISLITCRIVRYPTTGCGHRYYHPRRDGTIIEIINKNSSIRFNSYKRSLLYIKDEELRYIDELIDDRIINLY